MMKKLFTFLTIALSIMQLYAQQTEIRRSEYRSMDDDGNFINVVQLEIGGRYFYDIDENTHTAIFKRWYGRENDTELIIPSSIDYNGVTYKIVRKGTFKIGSKSVQPVRRILHIRRSQRTAFHGLCKGRLAGIAPQGFLQLL